MNQRVKYVNDSENQNIGFQKIEIEELQEKLNFELPKCYVDFLQNAGKKSRILNFELSDANDLIELQNEFKSKIINSDLANFNFNVWCFSNSENDYLYFELNNDENPMVFLFRNELYPVDNGWNNKLGYTNEKYRFNKFINELTIDKYENTISQNIKAYTILIISAPFLLLLFLFLELGKRMK